MLTYMYKMSQYIGFVCSDATQVGNTAVSALGFKSYWEYRQAFPRRTSILYQTQIADPKLYFSELSNRLDNEMLVPVWPTMAEALECGWLSGTDEKELWFCVDWGE